MFKTFLGSLTQWIEEKNLTRSAYYHSGANLNISILSPDLNRIKRSFLRSIVPAETGRLWANQPVQLDLLLKELFGFSAYLSENKLKSVIDTSSLSLISTRQKQELSRRLSAFLSLQNNWSDGSWHLLLTNDSRFGFQTVMDSALFDDPWQCAGFLSACGYHVPASKHAMLGWQKWCGEQPTDNGFEFWWNLLQINSESQEEIHRIDRLLDCLFNPHHSILPRSLCQNPESCTNCGLTDSCRFFQSFINPELGTERQNLIKTGDIKCLSTNDLLIFLAGTCWFNTEYQQSLMAGFPLVSDVQFADVSVPVEEIFLCKLLVVKELFQRTTASDMTITGKAFTNANDIYEFFKQELTNDLQESFYTVILDNKHRIIAKRLITLGTLNQSLVHPREVFATAIQLRSAAVILIHNHPSGDPSPSNQDIAITKRLQDVGEIVGIKVLDHIIIGSNRFFSFVDEDLITF